MKQIFDKIVLGLDMLLTALFKTALACLNSKKFLALIAGITTTVFASHGIILTPDDVTAVFTLFSTFIGGQTVVDLRHAADAVSIEKIKLETLKLEVEKLNLLKEQNKNV